MSGSHFSFVYFLVFLVGTSSHVFSEGRLVGSGVHFMSVIQGCHLIPLSDRLSCFSASSLALSVCSFFMLMVHSPDFFPENSRTFFVKN